MVFNPEFRGIDEEVYEDTRPVSVWAEQRLFVNTAHMSTGLRGVANAWAKNSTAWDDGTNFGDRPLTAQNGYVAIRPFLQTVGLRAVTVQFLATFRRYAPGSVEAYDPDVYLDFLDSSLNRIAEYRLDIQPGEPNTYRHVTATVELRESYRGPRSYAAVAIRIGGQWRGSNTTVDTDIRFNPNQDAWNVLDIDVSPPTYVSAGPTGASPDICVIWPENANNQIWGQPGEIEVFGFSADMEKICTSRPIAQSDVADQWTLQQLGFMQIASISIQTVFNDLIVAADVLTQAKLQSRPDAELTADVVGIVAGSLQDQSISGNLVAHGPDVAGHKNPAAVVFWPSGYTPFWPFVRGDEGWTDIIDVSVDINQASGTIEVPLFTIPTIHSVRAYSQGELDSYNGKFDFELYLMQLGDNEVDWDTAIPAQIVGEKTLSAVQLPVYQTGVGVTSFLRTQAILQGVLEGAAPSILRTNAEYYAHREGIIYPDDLQLINAILLAAVYEGANTERPLRVYARARWTDLDGYEDHTDMNQARLTIVGWGATESEENAA